jgi:D-serine deaminase-like pyridoxal phosphate-dependent protein
VCITPDKLERVAGLLKRGADLKVITDDVWIAREIVSRGSELAVSFPVLIEINVGQNRTGFAPEDDGVLEAARTLSSGARFEGIIAHAGNSYSCRSIAAIVDVAEKERAGAVRAAERVRAIGIPCSTVSVGSTPTVTHGTSWKGVTELRAGVYMFGDLFQAGIKSLGVPDIAVSVLSSVVGFRHEMNRFIIDAGALALSKDRSTQELPDDAGFGLIRAADGTAASGMCVAKVAQEHGYVDCDDPAALNGLQIGQRVRVLPNHACITAAMYDKYYVTDGGDDVVTTWERINGW